MGKQQLVEIAKALSRNIKLLILDEPTSALNENDSENLLELIRDLKNHGVTCIMISHKLKEVISIADRVTVLRDGQTVVTLDAHQGEVNENVLIKHMVGREIDNIYPPRQNKNVGEVTLEVKHWNAYDPQLGRDILKDVNFNVRKGEIVGFAGLMGSGRTELALSLFGNAKRYRVNGEMVLQGKPAEEYRTSLNIKTPSIEQKVGNLSGGNQQKVCLGKWLFVKPNILILDEPTRGIDVGAKFEIYTLMNKLVEEGMSIIMISSELPEVLGMSDRVYIVSAGRITGELPIEEATQEKIMALATN